MELNVWNSASIEGGAKYDESTQEWTTKVVREGQEPREMKVKHIVLATGFSGEARIPKFEGLENFKGPTPHSSKHKGAKEWAGKKAIVVGCCNSGHDIAAEFYEHGCDTTIVQRSSTYVVSSKHGLPAWLNGFYQEGGPHVDDADVLFTSLPTELVGEFHKISTAKVAELDKPILDGLEKAGFKLNRYNSGLFMKYFRDGGGYYLDVGCSQLIADGKIKVKQGQEIKRFTENGIEFADGDFREADIVRVFLLACQLRGRKLTDSLLHRRSSWPPAMARCETPCAESSARRSPTRSTPAGPLTSRVRFKLSGETLDSRASGSSAGKSHAGPDR